jgi:uncharacterized membrane protein YjdF
MNKLYLFSLIFFFSLISVSASDFGYNNPTLPKINPAVITTGGNTTNVYNNITNYLNGTTFEHNNLTGLQGGVAEEYYHLTLSAFNSVMAGITTWITKATADTYYANIKWGYNMSTGGSGNATGDYVSRQGDYINNNLTLNDAKIRDNSSGSYTRFDGGKLIFVYKK